MKCIIIDDEPIARKGMKRLTDSRAELETVAMFDNCADAETFLRDNDIDLVFLDIELPVTSGIELCRRISGKCMVIFTTAYSEYAIDSYEVEALDYLVKPISPERFNKAVDRAISYKMLRDDAQTTDDGMDLIIVKADRRYVRLRPSDILYVEGLGDYVIIHLADRRIVTRMTIKALEETLPPRYFLRVNKSYIVNIDRVDSFDNNDIYIASTEIAIGISYRDSVLNVLLGNC